MVPLSTEDIPRIDSACLKTTSTRLIAVIWQGDLHRFPQGGQWRRDRDGREVVAAAAGTRVGR